MRTGAALVGSTETTICRIAGAQLARFYGIPSHTTAPNSDNHAHDEQNAWEKTFSQFCSVAAGNDLIVNCGMFVTGMTCSHEQLIMDEEISAMTLRIAEGIRVDDDTLPVELIKQLGPKGDYLTADHTRRWLRRDEYLKPRVTVRGPYATWQAAGSKDTYQISKDRVQQLESRGAGSPLDPDRAAALAEVLAVFAQPA
jgi:trimethylamine--corrinoid protein Co-methyltransferase